MKTLVTGANGLVGSHLVDLLVQRGESVRALVLPDDPSERLRTGNVEVLRGDLRNAESVVLAVTGVDRVLHCAARKGPWGPWDQYEAVNVQGVRNLLRAAMAAGVRRFVHVSSITVLGSDINGSGDESLPFRHEPNPYTRSKIQAELLLQEEIRRNQAPVTIVRPGLIYGPRDTGSFGRFASLLQQGKMVVIGPGMNHLPLVYVRDVAESILLAAEKSRAIGGAYNIVNDQPVTQREYVAAIATELGVAFPKRHIPYSAALTAARLGESVGHLIRSRRPPPLTRFGAQLLGGENLFSINLARQELGFSPRVNLAEGVRLSVAWFREFQPPKACN